MYYDVHLYEGHSSLWTMDIHSCGPTCTVYIYYLTAVYGLWVSVLSPDSFGGI